MNIDCTKSSAISSLELHPNSVTVSFKKGSSQDQSQTTYYTYSMSEQEASEASNYSFTDHSIGKWVNAYCRGKEATITIS